MPTAPAKSAAGNLSGFMPADAAELAERPVSRYQSARDNRGKPIALAEILEAIQAGYWEKPVAAIREALAAGDAAKAETLKTNLEGFTVSGVFAPTRAKINLKEPTGCIIVDVDGLAGTAEAEATRDTLGTDPHVLAAFVSPSGRGVKAIIYCGTCADDADEKRLPTYTVVVRAKNVASVKKRLATAFDSGAVVSVEKQTFPKTKAERLGRAEGFVEDAKGIVEELLGEVESRRDNMPENLQNGETADRLSECADGLQSIVDALGEVDFSSIEFPGAFGQ